MRIFQYILFFIFLFGIFIFPAKSFGQEIGTTEKLISVDTGKQMVTAWENGQVVLQTSVSTGLWQTPTVKGNFRIYRKVPVQDMRGYSKVNGWYHLKNVPHVMYFYQSYALHGAYWHNNFGVRMSNGCVNLRPSDAERLYGFADVGTRVVVY